VLQRLASDPMVLAMMRRWGRLGQRAAIIRGRYSGARLGSRGARGFYSHEVPPEREPTHLVRSNRCTARAARRDTPKLDAIQSPDLTCQWRNALRSPVG
jgi:hypothetical protein